MARTEWSYGVPNSTALIKIVLSFRPKYPRPRLLNVKKEKLSSVEDEKSLLDEQAAHKDERQIGLDTDRSFVLYPVGGNRLYARHST